MTKAAIQDKATIKEKVRKKFMYGWIDDETGNHVKPYIGDVAKLFPDIPFEDIKRWYDAGAWENARNMMVKAPTIPAEYQKMHTPEELNAIQLGEVRWLKKKIETAIIDGKVEPKYSDYIRLMEFERKLELGDEKEGGTDEYQVLISGMMIKRKIQKAANSKEAIDAEFEVIDEDTGD